MNKILVTKLAALLCLASMVSCADHPFDDWKTELYTRNFIKEFGLIDPEQDWNMAKEASVTINVGDERTDLTVYSKFGNTYYLVADLKGMKGQFNVPFDVPKSCTEVMVKINGQRYYGTIDNVIVCTDHPASRSSFDSDGNFIYSPDDPKFEYTPAATNVKAEIKPLDYLYFNAMQMGPITRKEDWPDYWSYGDAINKGVDKGYKINANKKDSDGKGKGILPEIGKENQSYTDGNSSKHDGITEDFVFQMKNPDEGFTIYPMFYGSNLRHTLGFYLLDSNNKPIRENPNDPTSPIVKYPIYQSKHGDDIQVKEDATTRARVAVIQYIDTRTGKPIPYNSNGKNQLTLRVGDTVDVKVRALNMYGEVLDGKYVLSEQNDANGYISYTLSDENCTGGQGRTISITGAQRTSDTKEFKSWPKVTVNGVEFGKKDGEGDMNFFVVVNKRESPVKKIKVFNGNDPITEVSVYQDETLTYDVKIYGDDETTPLDWATYKNDISLTEWHTNMFTTELDRDNATLSVTGIGSGKNNNNEIIWDQYQHLYVNDNGAWSESDTRNCPIHIIVKPAYEEHSASVTYTGNDGSAATYPATTTNNPTWQSYFYTQAEADAANGVSTGDAPKRNTKSTPKRKVPRKVTVWEGNLKLAWSSQTITSEYFGQLSAGDKLIFTFTKSGGFKIQLDYPLSLSSETIDSPYTYEITSTEVTNFTNQGQKKSISVNGTGFTLTKIEAEISNGSDVEAGEWKPGAKAQMETDLRSYYTNLAISGLSCGKSGHSDQINSSDQGVSRTVDVTVTGSKQSEAAYSVTVTLNKKVRIYNPSSAPRNKSKKSSKASSSADEEPAQVSPEEWAKLTEEWEKLTANGGALSMYNADGTEATWHDINMVYGNVSQTTDAYVISDNPMLVRSRGYEIKIKDPQTGKPWEGYFGMYIDWEWGDYDTPDPTVVSYLHNPANGRPLKGTHYSQSSLNILEYDGKEFPISYAASFKHPMSDNEYLCFEDWPVTKPNGDKYYENNQEKTYGGSYSGWDWGSATGDYSSDRDMNDIIYRQKGLVAKRSSELTSEAKGFSWIWALEDLGSTDDFDFNDVVIRITSLTTSTEVEGSDDPVIVKNITFKPLAAGGTLPVYIHFKYTDSDNNLYDYVLKPGEYDLTSGSHSLSTQDGMEYHKWFGDQWSSTTMINTIKNRHKVSEVNIRQCTLIVPRTFKINGVPQHGSANSNNNVTMDGNGAQFYVTINGPVVETTQENVNGNSTVDRLDENGPYTVGLPSLGAAAQSFIIVEQRQQSTTTTDETGAVIGSDNSQTQNYAKPWYWPTERSHILDAYPHFKDWISNHQNQTWYLLQNADEEYLYIP